MTIDPIWLILVGAGLGLLPLLLMMTTSYVKIVVVLMLVRNALFLRVRLAATGSVDELGKLDAEWGWRAPVWQRALDRFFEEHDEIWLGADARSAAYFSIDEKDERSGHVWHVHQVFRDSDDDHDFGIWADVDLDATQDEGAVVFSSYRVGFVDDEPGMGHRQG